MICQIPIEKFLRSNRRAEQIYVIGGQDQISNKVFNKILMQ